VVVEELVDLQLIMLLYQVVEQVEQVVEELVLQDQPLLQQQMGQPTLEVVEVVITFVQQLDLADLV
tara:strand:- start:39 stop:236 length:198 start_codon:yes stop_codon:yes gene_type:complete